MNTKYKTSQSMKSINSIVASLLLLLRVNINYCSSFRSDFALAFQPQTYSPLTKTKTSQSHYNKQSNYYEQSQQKYQQQQQHGDEKTRLYSTRSNRSNNNQRNNSSQPPSTQEGVTSTLISSLAIIALKLRLKSQSSVQCNVQSSSKELLLNQSVGPVSVKGRDWVSPLQLTCKAIQADVNTCLLDMNSVLTKRKLILLEPAKGTAMIAFNNVDFGNFLNHPLLQAQAPKLNRDNDSSSASSSSVEETKFVFLKDDIEIRNDSNGDGYVTFYGQCMGQRWKCILKRGTNNSNGGKTNSADIKIVHDGNEKEASSSSSGDIKALEMELTMIVTSFFNDLVFELDGTFLAYKDLKFHTPKKKKRNNNNGNMSDEEETNVLFALDITVKKFPSPGLAF